MISLPIIIVRVESIKTERSAPVATLVCSAWPGDDVIGSDGRVP